MVRNNNIDNLLLCTILHAVHGNLYRLTLSRRTGTRHIEYSISACGRRCSSVCPNSIRTFPGTCRLSLLFFLSVHSMPQQPHNRRSDGTAAADAAFCRASQSAEVGLPRSHRNATHGAAWRRARCLACCKRILMQLC